MHQYLLECSISYSPHAHRVRELIKAPQDISGQEPWTLLHKDGSEPMPCPQCGGPLGFFDMADPCYACELPDDWWCHECKASHICEYPRGVRQGIMLTPVQIRT